MDYATALWSDELDDLIGSLQDDGAKFLPLKWTSDYDGKDYYSVIFTPCGYVHIEFVGTSVESTNEDLFQAYDRPRVFFNERSNIPHGSSDRQVPLTISRATARIEDLKDFYSEDLGVEVMKNEVYDDGSEVLVIALPLTTYIVQLVFW